MKNKFILVLFAVVFALPVSGFDLIADNAGIFTAGEIKSLSDRVALITARYNFDLVILTETGIGNRSPQAYADDFFDYGGYGFGPNSDGSLILLVTGRAVGDRDYQISNSGRGIQILNSVAEEKLTSEMVSYLRENRFYAAMNSYLDDWEMFLDLESKGRSYNFFTRWNLVLVLIGWAIAFGIGFLVVFIWKKGMDNVVPQKQAGSYVVPGSLSFNVQKDSFLYSVTSKSKRDTQSSSGGGIRTGSSGRSHSGGGGKF